MQRDSYSLYKNERGLARTASVGKTDTEPRGYLPVVSDCSVFANNERYASGNSSRPQAAFWLF